MQGALTAWAQTIPGATVGGTNLGGKAVTSVTFSDGSAPLYYYLYGPSTLYFVRTADQALATSAFSQLP